MDAVLVYACRKCGMSQSVEIKTTLGDVRCKECGEPYPKANADVVQGAVDEAIRIVSLNKYLERLDSLMAKAREINPKIAVQ